MRKKRFLAAILLGAVLCFMVSGVGYGEILGSMTWEREVTFWEIQFLEARINYMMKNPTSYLNLDFGFDMSSDFLRTLGLPIHVKTEDKISVIIGDTRDVFSHKSGKDLLDEFERILKTLHLSSMIWVTDIENDIFAIFFNIDGNPIGYFYQGEYHLWDE